MPIPDQQKYNRNEIVPVSTNSSDRTASFFKNNFLPASTKVKNKNQRSERLFFTDPDVQRGFCWSGKNKIAYLRALNHGHNATPIVVIDCDAALDWEEHRFSKKDEEIVKRLKTFTQEKHKKYSILDGQHRLTTLYEFFNNELEVSGKFFDENNDCHTIEEPTVFANLPEGIRERFKSSMISVKVYDAPYTGPSGASSIFTNLNEGINLSHQEKRSGKSTPMSVFIRDLANVHDCSILTNVSSMTTKRKKNEEVILDALLLTKSDTWDSVSYDVNTKERNRWYDAGEGQLSLNHVNEYKNTCDIFKNKDLRMVRKLVEKRRAFLGEKKVPMGEYYILLLFARHLRENGFQDFDFKKFNNVGKAINHIMSNSATIEADSANKHNELLKEWASNDASSKNAKPSQTDTYGYKLSVFKDPGNRNYIYNELKLCFDQAYALL